MLKTLYAILLLLFTANGAPSIARNWLGSRYDWPVDGGMVWSDGKPLRKVCTVISGGQFMRTSTMQAPEPTEVYPCKP